MEKLKTLKGMKYLHATSHTDDGEWFEEPYVDKNQLRNEAIKWIKQIELATIDEVELDDMPPYSEQDKLGLDNWQGHLKSTVVWIKHFFNITDEELK